MAIRYKKLFHLLVKRKMTTSALEKKQFFREYYHSDDEG